MVAKTITDVILGEAVSGTREQRYADMVSIASVIQNRATLANRTPQSIISAKGEFDAYGKSLPKGVNSYRDLAEQAWNQVQTTGPVHNATYYATSKAKSGLPGGLTPVSKTEGHEFFADPKGRSFRTAEGFVTPATETHAAMMAGNLVAPQNPYSGLVPPAPVQTVSLPQTAPAPVARADVPAAPGRTITPGAGLANLAPRGLAGVDYSMGPNRPNPPSQDITSLARSVATDVLGPGSRVSVVSGMENPGRQYGSNRHKTGFAGDFAFYTPDGTRVSMANNPQAMRDIAQAAAAKGATGIGFGGGYMGGKSLHIDQVERQLPGYLSAGQGRQWGSGAKAMADTLEQSRATGIMPTPDSFRQGGIPTPTSRPENPVLAAPVAAVERSSLPSVEDIAKAAAYSDYGRSRMAPEARPASAAATARAGSGAGTQGSGTLSIPGVNPTANAVAAPAPPVAGGTLAAPPMADNTPVAPGFPAAPPQAGFPQAPVTPGRQARTAAVKGGVLGAITGGPVGAIAGAVLGPARNQIRGNIRSNRMAPPGGRQNIFNGVRDQYRGLFNFGGGGGLGGMFSGIPAPNYSAPSVNVGSGYGAIGSVFGAPAGATAYANSNPNIGFTSLGNGYVSRTNADTGVTYTMAPGDYDAGMFGGKSGKGK